MITCDYNILIYRCLMINIEKLQTVMIDPAQLLVQWLLWILWIDDYIWLPLSIYPPVVTNIDVLFIHHICRSFSEWETMVSPWFLHLFFSIFTINESNHNWPVPPRLCASNKALRSSSDLRHWFLRPGEGMTRRSTAWVEQAGFLLLSGLWPISNPYKNPYTISMSGDVIN